MSIMDTLLLGPEELELVLRNFPGSVITNQSSTPHKIQQYMIAVNTEDEDHYYDFLFANWLAMSSTSFTSRLKTDPIFTEKIRQRIKL